MDLLSCRVNRTLQDNFWSVLLDTCCVEKSSAAGFPGIVNAKCLFRKFLSLGRSRNFLICLELGHYSFKIHILNAVPVGLFTLSKKGVRGCFQKKWIVGTFIVPVLETSLNGGGEGEGSEVSLCLPRSAL